MTVSFSGCFAALWLHAAATNSGLELKIEARAHKERVGKKQEELRTRPLCPRQCRSDTRSLRAMASRRAAEQAGEGQTEKWSHREFVDGRPLSMLEQFTLPALLKCKQ